MIRTTENKIAGFHSVRHCRIVELGQPLAMHVQYNGGTRGYSPDVMNILRKILFLVHDIRLDLSDEPECLQEIIDSIKGLCKKRLATRADGLGQTLEARFHTRGGAHASSSTTRLSTIVRRPRLLPFAASTVTRETSARRRAICIGDDAHRILLRRQHPVKNLTDEDNFQSCPRYCRRKRSERPSMSSFRSSRKAAVP